MIAGFRHKGLMALYEGDSTKEIRTDVVGRVRVLLAILDEAQSLSDLTRPSLRLHALSGEREGDWSVTVNARWRITFTYEASEFGNLNLEVYR